MKEYNKCDLLLIAIDNLLRPNRPKSLSYPEYSSSDPIQQDETKRKKSIRVMRVNHAGELAAQGLYEGQAISATNSKIRAFMYQSAKEEYQHLNWCENRLRTLQGQTSVLKFLWMFGSLTIGYMAGKMGNRWSLGFIAETEHQVMRHLDTQLQQLPKEDIHSRTILERIRADEAHHVEKAINAGGIQLPARVKLLMALSSKIMVYTAYWI